MHSSCMSLIGFLAMSCLGNQYDPHLYPARGPFFEGWYVRLIDETKSLSIGFLFGRVLPKLSDHNASSQNGSAPSSLNLIKDRTGQYFSHQQHRKETPLVIASILLQDRNFSQKLLQYTGIFRLSDYSVTVRGKPVVKNPDSKSPVDFTVIFRNNGSFIVKENKTVVDISIGNVRLNIRAGTPSPWRSHGEGPEEWLEKFPLPLHWFVYSLCSYVTEYRFFDADMGRVISGKNAYMHMEKNWGKSFPAAWVWSQGITNSNITVALSGGIVNFDQIVSVTAFLVGYRNPSKGIIFDFMPANSVFSFEEDGCHGIIFLNVTSLMHRLELKIFSLIESFSDCLLGPESEGFQPDCIESYDARAVVRAYVRTGLHFKQVDDVEIRNVALEFGGKYVCNNKCLHA